MGFALIFMLELEVLLHISFQSLVPCHKNLPPSYYMPIIISLPPFSISLLFCSFDEFVLIGVLWPSDHCKMLSIYPFLRMHSPSCIDFTTVCCNFVYMGICFAVDHSFKTIYPITKTVCFSKPPPILCTFLFPLVILIILLLKG